MIGYFVALTSLYHQRKDISQSIDLRARDHLPFRTRFFAKAVSRDSSLPIYLYTYLFVRKWDPKKADFSRYLLYSKEISDIGFISLCKMIFIYGSQKCEPPFPVTTSSSAQTSSMRINQVPENTKLS